jgi:hypothetical protein
MATLFEDRTFEGWMSEAGSKCRRALQGTGTLCRMMMTFLRLPQHVLLIEQLDYVNLPACHPNVSERTVSDLWSAGNGSPAALREADGR